jgi:hypothetical protein
MKTNIIIIVILQLLVFSCRETTTPTIDTITQRSVSAFSYVPLDVEPIKFTLDNSRDTFLFGRSGVLIYVPAGAFMGRGSNTRIDLYLKEYQQPYESLAQPISTSTGSNQLLYTNTIVHLEARQGMANMHLAPQQAIRLHFERSPEVPEMQLWQGTPKKWKVADNDRPKLFNHMLKIGAYDERQFANGQSIEIWEKQNLGITTTDQNELWEQDLAYLHLNYTINKEGRLEDVKFKEPIAHDFQRRILKTMQSYPLCKPHLVDGSPQEVTCEYAFHVHQAEPKYKEDLNYLQLLQNQYPPLTAQGISHIDQLELKYHIFNVEHLGWLAAGQETDILETVDLIVELEPSVIAEVKIFLKNSKAVLMGKREGNSIVFEGLPEDEPLSVFALSQRGEQPLLAVATANSSDGIVENLKFSKASYEEIRSTLKTVSAGN